MIAGREKAKGIAVCLLNFPSDTKVVQNAISIVSRRDREKIGNLFPICYSYNGTRDAF